MSIDQIYKKYKDEIKDYTQFYQDLIAVKNYYEDMAAKTERMFPRGKGDMGQ